MQPIESTQRSTAYDMSKFVPFTIIQEYFNGWAEATVTLLIPSIKKNPFRFDEAILSNRVDELKRTAWAFALGNDEIGSTTIGRSNTKEFTSYQTRYTKDYGCHLYASIVVSKLRFIADMGAPLIPVMEGTPLLSKIEISK
jgi:hypothetical protein